MKKTLNEKLAQVQTELKTKKTKFNKFGKYYYRTAEDILEAVKPFLLPLKLSVRIKEKLIGTSTIESTAIITDGISRYKASAIVAVDLNQKGMQMPQRFGAASSYGKKYALGNLFLIDDTKDSDATNQHKVIPKLIKGGKEWYDVIKVLEAGKDWNYVEKTFSVSPEYKKQIEQLIEKSIKI